MADRVRAEDPPSKVPEQLKHCWVTDRHGRLPARGLQAGADGSSFIFATAAGSPPHQNTVGHQWRRTLSKAGLAGIKLPDLRHFYAPASSTTDAT